MQLKISHDFIVGSIITLDESYFNAGRLLCDLNDVKAFSQSVSTAAAEVSSLSEEMKSSSQVIASRAKETEDSSMSCGSSISAVKANIGEIEKLAEDTLLNVKSLNEFTDQITDFAKQITNISKQTNLLALNASIEAARSGEAGKGFAVVANEVKSLSNKIGEATSGINQLLQALRASMELITANAAKNIYSIKDGLVTLDQVEGSMRDIQTHATDVSRGINDISIHISIQSAKTKTISSDILSVFDRLDRMRDAADAVVSDISAYNTARTSGLGAIESSSLEAKTVTLAKTDHTTWKKRLANMLIGKEGLNADELSDSTTCRLGKWYTANKEAPLAKTAAFKEIEHPHYLVHHHGKESVRCYNRGAVSEALEEIKKVDAASKDVQRLLDVLRDEKSAK